MIVMQWLEDYALRTADRVVSVLPAAEEYMVARGMHREKFIHIPNGIDADSDVVCAARTRHFSPN